MFPPDRRSTQLKSSNKIFRLSLPPHQLLGEEVVVAVVGVQPGVPVVPVVPGPAVAGSVLLPGLLSTLSLLIPP